jgi:uncharacterized membrane protein
MLPTKFRRLLRQEANSWAREELIDRSTYDRLASKYRFDDLDIESRNTFVTILISCGCILIGLGLLTFVAANWQGLAREWRVLLLFSLFAIVNIGGFYLWNSERGSNRRLGEGLLLLGALILGGNMALMGQTFHVEGEVHALLITWAIGISMMAYVLRITSLGILATILMGIGFWQPFFDWSGSNAIDSSWIDFVRWQMSIVAPILFVPLAYICRSPAIFTMAGIGFISAFQARLDLSSNLALAVACSIPPILLWGYGNLSLSWPIHQQAKISAFPKIARKLAVLSLGLSCFVLSFSELWSGLNTDRVSLSFISLNGAVWTIASILIWSVLIWKYRRQIGNPPLDLNAIAIVGFSLILAVAILVVRVPAPSSIICWLLLFLIGGGLIKSGLAQSDRQAFWAGISLVITRISAWFLFIQTDLLFKSLLLAVCGASIIAIGLWFERYVRRLANTQG